MTIFVGLEKKATIQHVERVFKEQTDLQVRFFMYVYMSMYKCSVYCQFLKINCSRVPLLYQDLGLWRCGAVGLNSSIIDFSGMLYSRALGRLYSATAGSTYGLSMSRLGCAPESSNWNTENIFQNYTRYGRSSSGNNAKRDFF